MATITLPIKQDTKFVDFYFSLNSLCRICLEKPDQDKKTYKIFGTDNPQICTMIMTCTSVQLSESDRLPSTICQRCLENLLVAWNFKQLCESSDNKLRQLNVDNIQPSISEKETGLKANEEETLFIIRTDSVSEADDDVEFEPIIRTENVNKCDVRNGIKEKPKRKRLPQHHQCETCGKTFIRREYLTQHIRIHTGEKPYVCHICDRRFINSGHLTTHMRTHTGERPHVCSMCPKAFSTRQELRKHTMVHNGDRPFVCNTCGKKFGSSSNLYTHMRHHTGEKNYTCEQCGKAFYTNQELRQHLLIHSGEKPYLCDVCNKKFTQIAHLRRHKKLHVIVDGGWV